jgi:hypothetical protein
MSTTGGERATLHYCPYCGDEDLRPEEGGHRRWSCRSCQRVFEVSFVGLLGRGGEGQASGESRSTSGQSPSTFGESTP